MAGTVRRRVDGPSVTRKITMSAEEDLQLADIVRRAGSNLAEVLVRAALEADAGLTRQEHRHLLASINALRNEVGELMIRVRGMGAEGVASPEQVDEVLTAGKALLTSSYNAVENLAIR